MSVAIVQGSSGGLGAALAKHLLTNTSLKVYALTHRSSSKELKEQLGGASDRLTVLEGIDVKEEESLHKAAEAVKGREGKGSVRLVACLAGVVSLSFHVPCNPLLSLMICQAEPREIARSGRRQDRP